MYNNIPTQPGNLTNYQFGPWGNQLLGGLQPIPMPGQTQQQPPNQSTSGLQGMSQIMQMFQKFGQQQPRAANGQFMSQQDAAAQQMQTLGSDQYAPTLGMDNSYMGYGDQGSQAWGMDASGGGGAGFMGYGA